VFLESKYYGKRKHIINKSDKEPETDDFGGFIISS
jgi:hypothetical protein